MLLNIIPAALLACENGFRFAHCSHALMSTLGVKPDVIEGKRMLDFFHSEDARAVEPIMVDFARPSSRSQRKRIDVRMRVNTGSVATSDSPQPESFEWRWFEMSLVSRVAHDPFASRAGLAEQRGDAASKEATPTMRGSGDCGSVAAESSDVGDVGGGSSGEASGAPPPPPWILVTFHEISARRASVDELVRELRHTADMARRVAGTSDGDAAPSSPAVPSSPAAPCNPHGSDPQSPSGDGSKEREGDALPNPNSGVSPPRPIADGPQNPSAAAAAAAATAAAAAAAASATETVRASGNDGEAGSGARIGAGEEGLAVGTGREGAERTAEQEGSEQERRTGKGDAGEASGEECGEKVGEEGSLQEARGGGEGNDHMGEALQLIGAVNAMLKEGQKNSMFHTIFEMSMDPMFIVSMEFKILDCNPAAVRHMRYSSKAEAIAKFDALGGAPALQADGRPSAEVAGPQVEKMLRGETVSFEWRHLAADGTPFDVLLNVREIVVEGQRCMLSVWHDLSAMKRKEEELKAAKEAAEAASEAKNRFLANMSHELRTPMNGVIGVAELLLRTPLTAEQRMYLDVICSSGNALMHIISDVLDITKIESRSLLLESYPFDLRQTIAESLDAVRVAATRKGLRLSSSVCEQLPGTVVGDQFRVRQIVLHLLSNAIKFTEVGSVSVSVTTSTDRPLLEGEAGVQAGTGGKDGRDGAEGGDRLETEGGERRESGVLGKRTRGEEAVGAVAAATSQSGEPSIIPNRLLKRLKGGSEQQQQQQHEKPQVTKPASVEAGEAAAATPPVWVRIDVRDSGMGMSEESIAQLFTPFRQVDDTSCRKHGGTGLGLSICRSLASLMGGSIAVSSSPLYGSTFTVCLPLQPSRQSPFRPSPSSNPLPSSSPLASAAAAAVTHRAAAAAAAAGVATAAAAATSGKSGSEEGLGVGAAPATPGSTPLLACPFTSYLNSELGPILAELDSSDLDDCRFSVLDHQRVRGGQQEAAAGQAGAANDSAKAGAQGRRTEQVQGSAPGSACGAPGGSGGKGSREGRGGGSKSGVGSGQMSFEGVRCLVVEDNAVNRMVVVQLLRNLRVTCDVAENGLKAVEACKTTNYHIIFMDCHMPVMDGFEATTRIRSLQEMESGTSNHCCSAAVRKEQQQQQQQSPTGQQRELQRSVIYALTASVLKHERDKCAKSGMDGFLAKPIRMRDLQQVLSQVLAKPPVQSCSAACHSGRALMVPMDQSM